ncbi:hypothetical protein N7537_007095 [Penicillium hordei]|uniref:Uncharacterized protein n=1 Tax=Penicillium hordei TaxID=40994 RepID=A0AAD6E926_9EURO|nr:uncharacterized protein N7537_007095 [Penicillium hordei]KAJ5604139.1 hypothetical protein N7537_007095 [Penicillium hordei]
MSFVDNQSQSQELTRSARVSGIHHLRSVSVPSASLSVARLLSGCLGRTSPWLVVASTFHLLSRFTLYPPLLPLPTVYVPRSAVERLNTPTFGGNFELPNYFTSPTILFLSPTSLPQCGCGFSCLSTIAYLYSIGYLRLIQLSPTCEINSLNGCPSVKHTKPLALALLV